LGIKMLDFTALKHFQCVVMEEVNDGERSCDGVVCKQIDLEVMEQDCLVGPAMIVIGNHVFWVSERGGSWLSQNNLRFSINEPVEGLPETRPFRRAGQAPHRPWPLPSPMRSNIANTSSSVTHRGHVLTRSPVRLPRSPGDGPHALSNHRFAPRSSRGSAPPLRLPERLHSDAPRKLVSCRSKCSVNVTSQRTPRCPLRHSSMRPAAKWSSCPPADRTRNVP
jgi:hypothetical protein